MGDLTALPPGFGRIYAAFVSHAFPTFTFLQDNVDALKGSRDVYSGGLNKQLFLVPVDMARKDFDFPHGVNNFFNRFLCIFNTGS
jgi:hypothetical protein